MSDKPKPNQEANDSVVLKRLIEEVRREEEEGKDGTRPNAYDRFHNRHNRS